MNHLRTWIASTPDQPWHEAAETRAHPADDLVLGEPLQTIEGFGGCFNELGTVALNTLPTTVRQTVLDALFDAHEGAGFTLCRLPMGASDFATRWYSYNEVEGDVAMEKFSIEPDRRLLLPYVEEARRRNPGLRFFSSPWSPPTWMKFPAVYNFGRLRMEEPILKAYALYFLKYLRAYEAEGITIEQVHIQNEPFADQKFPSCLWTADQYLVFIRDYLGPLFDSEKVKTEIWFGTLNGPEIMKFTPAGITLDPYHEYVEKVLLDPGAASYIRGVGYQWAGRQNIARTHLSFPHLKLMQTENECGDGTNTWEYAFYVFTLLHLYLSAGANAYIYWNLVLARGGQSTWGWPQNSLVTVSEGQATFNPEFYVMKHFARFVLPGARLLSVSGVWASSALAFRNPDGSTVVVAANFQSEARALSIGSTAPFVLEPRSINTLVLT